jgi:small subunit ribosomal protein S4
MGDPRKKRKSYQTPRHPWRKEQLEEELRLLGDYGLRNKRELRRHETQLSEIRGIARTLLGATEERQAQLEKDYLKRMSRLGYLPETANVDNILDLNVKDLMERRLQTIVYRTGLARTIHQARQFVGHGHISIGGNIVTIPGYLVRKEEESRIAFHTLSPVSNSQHPARIAPGPRRPGRPTEEAAQAPQIPAGPAMVEVPAEIKEIAQTEQPIEIAEPEEELPEEAAEKTP